jgi:hypothetical protein
MAPRLAKVFRAERRVSCPEEFGGVDMQGRRTQRYGTIHVLSLRGFV